jgi:hypothetical protein
LVFVCLLGLFAGFANGQAVPIQPSDTGYEAVLNILVGSNEASPGKGLPKSLSAVQRQLNENFAYSNYTLSNTLLSRLSSPGDVEYKSVSDRLGKEAGDYPTFVDWSLQLRPAAPTQAGRLQMENFRFGARVPVVTARIKGPDGQSPGTTAYEPIGLTTRRVMLPVGKPSLIGTVSLPGTAGMLFLVLTIRPAAD